jgi:adenylate kinase family enzyme
MADTPQPQRVVVLGTSGSGKSTFAGRLAELIGAEHCELDAFNHGPNWTPRPAEEFAASVASVVRRPRWVVDGNYVDRVSATLWPHADTVIWLDMPLRIVLPRIVRRTVRRIRNRTELWNGNREHWSALTSLLPWAVRSQRRHRAELPGRLAELERSGARVVRLTSVAAVERWLSEQVAT